MSSLTITTIQTALHWENKAANLQMLEEKIMGINEKTEIIILPEMFTTGFSMNAATLAEDMNGESVAWMKKMAIEKKSILVGSLIIKEGENFYNRLIWMLPNGQMGIYDKRHLFAYANEDQYYTPGNKRLIASVKGWKINLMICYDLRFPVWARQNPQPVKDDGKKASPEYDMLIYVANWPERRSHAWRTLLQARAIENQAYCLGVNRVGKDGKDIYYSGDSMVVDPLGEIIYHKQHDEDMFTFTIQKEEIEGVREKMPFWKDADGFILLQE